MVMARSFLLVVLLVLLQSPDPGGAQELGWPRCWGIEGFDDATLEMKGLAEVPQIPSRDLVVGFGSVCGIDGTGDVWCGGFLHGAVPSGLTSRKVKARQVLLGTAFACALLSDTSVGCFGYSGGRSWSSRPPESGGGVRQLVLGRSSVCLLLPLTAPDGSRGRAEGGTGDQGRVSCWSWVPASGGWLRREVPAEAWNSSLPIERLYGREEVLCALPSPGFGGLRCWGQLAPPPSGFERPMQLALADPSYAVPATESHACALLAGFSQTGKGMQLRCWGHNSSGQTDVPARVDLDLNLELDLGLEPEGAAQVKELALGSQHSCLLHGSRLHCWGSLHLQLGAVKQIRSARSRSCALLHDGTVRCWGQWYYGTGNGPERIRTAFQLFLGQGRACVLLRDPPLPVHVLAVVAVLTSATAAAVRAAVTGSAASSTESCGAAASTATQQLSEVPDLSGCKSISRAGDREQKGAAVVRSASGQSLLRAVRASLNFHTGELAQPPASQGHSLLFHVATKRAFLVELLPTAVHTLPCWGGGDRFALSEPRGLWQGPDKSFAVPLSAKHLLLWQPAVGLLQLTAKRTRMDNCIGQLVQLLPQLIPLIFGLVTLLVSIPVPDEMLVSLAIGPFIGLLCPRALQGCMQQNLGAAPMTCLRQALMNLPALARLTDLLVLCFALWIVRATDDVWLKILTALGIVINYLELIEEIAPATHSRAASAAGRYLRLLRCLLYLVSFLLPWFMQFEEVDNPKIGLWVASVVLSRVGEQFLATFKQPCKAVEDTEEGKEKDQGEGHDEEQGDEEEEEEQEVSMAVTKRAGNTLRRKDWDRLESELRLYGGVQEKGSFLAGYCHRRRLPCSTDFLRTAARGPHLGDTLRFLDCAQDFLRAASASSPTPATTAPAGVRIPAQVAVTQVILQERNTGRTLAMAAEASFETTRALLMRHMRDLEANSPLRQEMSNVVTVARKYLLEDAPYMEQEDDFAKRQSKIQVVVRPPSGVMDADSVEEVLGALTSILRDAVGHGQRRPEFFKVDYVAAQSHTLPAEEAEEEEEDEEEDEVVYPWRLDTRAVQGIHVPAGVEIAEFVLEERNSRDLALAAEASFETTRTLLQRHMKNFEVNGPHILRPDTDPHGMTVAVALARQCDLEDMPPSVEQENGVSNCEGKIQVVVRPRERLLDKDFVEEVQAALTFILMDVVGRVGQHRRRPVLFRVSYTAQESSSVLDSEVPAQPHASVEPPD